MGVAVVAAFITNVLVIFVNLFPILTKRQRRFAGDYGLAWLLFPGMILAALLIAYATHSIEYR